MQLMDNTGLSDTELGNAANQVVGLLPAAGIIRCPHELRHQYAERRLYGRPRKDQEPGH